MNVIAILQRIFFNVSIYGNWCVFQVWVQGFFCKHNMTREDPDRV